MGAYFDADQTCHFRHCARVLSKALGPSLETMYLTATISGTQFTGGLTVTGTQNDWKNQNFWLLTDNPAYPSEDDIGYVGFAAQYTNEPSPGPELFHNIHVSGSLGSQAAINISANDFDSTEKFCFVSHGASGFAIMIPGTNYCLTAGTTAASSISSSSVGVYVTAFSGAETQLWDIYEPVQLTGCYHMAPAGAPEMGICSPGQGLSSYTSLGIGAYEQDDITATWIAFYESWLLSFINESFILGYVGDRDTTTLYVFTATGSSLPEQGSQISASESMYRSIADNFIYAGRSLNPTYNTLHANNGLYYAKQYTDTTSGSSTALTSYHGTETVSQSPWVDTLSPSTWPSNISQFWYPVPQNLYDAGLPQCLDLQLIVRDNTLGTERILSSVDDIPSTSDITLIPRFICSEKAYVACMKISFSDPDSAEDSSWDIIMTPTSGNYPVIDEAPFATPNGPNAWSPNAWASATLDDEGYTTLTQGFDFPSGLFSGYSGQIASITLTIRPFAYEQVVSLWPWLPYAGRQSSMTYRIAPSPTASITSAVIDEHNLTLSGSVTGGWLGAGAMAIEIDDFTWYYFSGSPKYMRHALLDRQRISLHESSFSVKIPLTSLNGAAFYDVVSLLHGGTTVRFQGDVRLVSQYGSTTITVNQPLAWPATTTADDTTHLTVYHQKMYTEFSTPAMVPSSTQLDWTTSYVVAPSETGARLQPMLLMNSQFAFFAAGGELTGDGTYERALIFRRLHDDYDNQLFYQTWMASSLNIEMISSLTYKRTSDQAAVIIPLEGNVTTQYSESREISAAQRLGSGRYIASTNLTRTPTLKFTGTIFRHNFITSSSATVFIDASVSALYQIPPDAICTLRTSHGTSHQVMITSIESPRSIAGLAQVTINMIEVES